LSARGRIAERSLLGMVLASLPWRPTLDELTRRPGWQRQALCRGVGVDLFFPSLGGSTKAAKALCARCPVHGQCETYAAETGSGGIWAGKGRQSRYVGVIVSSGASRSR